MLGQGEAMQLRAGNEAKGVLWYAGWAGGRLWAVER